MKRNINSSVFFLTLFNFICFFSYSQTIEFRETRDYYDGNDAKASANELGPLYTSIERNKGSIDMIVYYTESINDAVYKKVVQSKEKDMSKGMLFYKLNKPYTITYNNYSGVFNYKVTLNGTSIYDGPSPVAPGNAEVSTVKGTDCFKEEKFFFDHREKTFAGKFGFYASISLFDLLQTDFAKINLLKEGNNEFKIKVSFEGNVVSEGTINYAIDKFKLNYESGCNNFYIAATQNKTETASFVKVINSKYADAYGNSGIKLTSVFSESEDWTPVRDDYNEIIYAKKHIVIIFQDASGNYMWVTRMFKKNYMGGGAYSETPILSYRDGKEFFYDAEELKTRFASLHKACYELLKAKYGVNK